MTNGNDNAYPVTDTNSDMGIKRTELVGGLTKREYFAGLAMQGMIASCTSVDFPFVTPEEAGINACKYADALIAELNKPQ